MGSEGPKDGFTVGLEDGAVVELEDGAVVGPEDGVLVGRLGLPFHLGSIGGL